MIAKSLFSDDNNNNNWLVEGNIKRNVMDKNRT